MNYDTFRKLSSSEVFLKVFLLINIKASIYENVLKAVNVDLNRKSKYT